MDFYGGGMMKKNWEMPRTVVQRFEPNEYVAACVTGTIQCAIPGQSETECDGASPTRFFDYHLNDNSWYGLTIYPDGYDHGLCGNPAVITFSDADGSGSGFEVNQGHLDRNRPIYNIDGYQLAPGQYHVTWNSNSGGPTYNHYGILTITNIDNDHPNHS